MKKLLSAVLLVMAVAMGPRPAFAYTPYPAINDAPKWSDMFKETEGAVLDWAIASSVEVGYARDLIGGRNAVIGQFPIVYMTPYLNADFGYVTGYDEKSRGSLMVGGTIRINRLIEDMWKGDLSLVKKNLNMTPEGWDRLWFGPWIAHGFTNDELLAGIKGGYRFDEFIFWK